MKTLILFTLLLFPMVSPAQDFAMDKDSGKAIPNFIGQVKLVKGEIFKKMKGELKAIGIGARFYQGDVLVTGEKAFVRVGMVDDTSLSLGSNSELQFSEFLFKEKNDRRGTFMLMKGQLSGQVKHKAKEGEINFKTKFATMGVRGTELLINHRKLKNYEISEFALTEGSAEVKNLKGRSSLLSAGKKVIYVEDEVRKKDALEETELTEAEKAELNKKVDEEKEFRPLMPYFDPGAMLTSSELYLFFNPKTESVSAQKGTETPGGTQKNWRDNLRKLNETLKKNQEESSR